MWYSRLEMQWIRSWRERVTASGDGDTTYWGRIEKGTQKTPV